MRHFLIITIIFLIIIGSMYIFLNTSWFISWAVPNFVAKHFPNIELQSFSFIRQEYKFPQTVILHELDFDIVHEGRVYRFRCPRLIIPDFVTFLQRKRQIHLLTDDLHFDTDGARVFSGDIHLSLLLKDFSITGAEGDARVKRLHLAKYQLQNFKGHFRSNEKQFQLYDIVVAGYGGIFKGQASVDYQPFWPHIIWLEFSDVNPQALSAINKTIFSNIVGPLKGSLRLVGNSQTIDIFTGDFETSQGSLIKPGLLQVIRDRASPYKAEALKSIAEAGRDLPIDKGSLHIQNTGYQKLLLLFNFDNKSEKLFFSEKISIDVKEGLKKFLLD